MPTAQRQLQKEWKYVSTPFDLNLDGINEIFCSNEARIDPEDQSISHVCINGLSVFEVIKRDSIKKLGTIYGHTIDPWTAWTFSNGYASIITETLIQDSITSQVIINQSNALRKDKISQTSPVGIETKYTFDKERREYVMAYKGVFIKLSESKKLFPNFSGPGAKK